MKICIRELNEAESMAVRGGGGLIEFVLKLLMPRPIPMPIPIGRTPIWL